MSKWQPIETAPIDGGIVLICGFSGPGKNGYFVADARWDGEWLMFSPDDDCHSIPCYKPTHWMPLPEPPQDDLQEGS